MTTHMECHQVNVKAQQANRNSLWHSIRHMIQVRKLHPAFGRGDFQWIDCKNNAIAAYTRSYENHIIYVVNNLSAGEQAVSIPLPESYKKLTDILTDTVYTIQDHTLTLELNPRQFLWLT